MVDICFMTIRHPQLYNPHGVKTCNLRNDALKSLSPFLILALPVSFVSQADLDKHIPLLLSKVFCLFVFGGAKDRTQKKILWSL